MRTVDILMATYNGELYIESQILSIISQSYKDWQLLIHDDGSSDSTISIIKKWSSVDSRIKFLDDGIKMGGAAKNFMHLLKYSTAEYIMLCDQDDIWFDNKVQEMVSVASKLSQDIPQVVYSNSYVWQPHIGILGKATLTFPHDLKSFLFLNSGMQGCVALFNSKIRDLMLQWKGDLAMHDHILHLIGLTLGNVTYMSTSLMLYRKHNANVTGSTKTQILSKTSIVNNRKIPVVSREHYDAVNSYVAQYGNLIDIDNRNILNIYLSLPGKKLIGRFFAIVRNRFKIYNSMLLIIIKVLLRPYM